MIHTSKEMRLPGTCVGQLSYPKHLRGFAGLPRWGLELHIRALKLRDRQGGVFSLGYHLISFVCLLSQYSSRRLPACPLYIADPVYTRLTPINTISLSAISFSAIQS